jgi:uncharacterized protein YggE
MLAGATYLGVAFVLEMIDRWNELDPATIEARKRARAEARAKAKALAAKTPLALPVATASSVEVQHREREPIVIEAVNADAID